MLIIMTVLAMLATAIALHKGVAREGLIQSARLLAQMAPVLLPAFVLAGMASTLITRDAIVQWLGQDAGLRGLLLGTAAGAVTPGGPFIAFPLLAVLLKSGASVGAVTSYLTAWALLGIHRVAALEIPILGWRFALVRYAASLLVPVLTGFLAQLLWVKLKLS